MAERMRLMAVHAHPDDESSKGAATTAKYVAEGHRVLVVSCTGGERGDVLNPALKDDPHILRDLAQVRRDEMARAVAILGCEHTWLGFVDSGLPEGDPRPPLPVGCFALEPLDTPTEALVREIRRFRPHVVTTYDENGGYGHPDHVRTHEVTLAALRLLDDPPALYARVTPESWWQQDLAGVGDLLTPERRDAWRVGAPADDHTARLSVVPDEQVTHVVADAAAVPRQVAALTQHRTQVRLLGEPAQAYALSNDIALLLTGREAYQQLDVATGEPLAAGGVEQG